MNALTAAGAVDAGSAVGTPEIISLSLAILAAAAAAWQQIATRRKLKAEAKSIDLKTPAEVDNLNAVTQAAEMSRVLEFNRQVLDTNADLVKRNDDLTARLESMGGKMDTVLENQRKQDNHTAKLEHFLEQAYSYIEDLLAWVERHVPGSVPPVPPRNYRPNFNRERQEIEGSQ